MEEGAGMETEEKESEEHLKGPLVRLKIGYASVGFFRPEQDKVF